MKRFALTLLLISFVALISAGCGDFFKSDCRVACENVDQECDLDSSDEDIDECTEECKDDLSNSEVECLIEADSCAEALTC